MSEQDLIVNAVKKALPGVVSITMSKYLEYSESPFGSFGLGFPGPAVPRRKKIKSGGGSGFIVDKSGIVLTNRHVVEDPIANYVVILQNGEKYTPEILGRDPINDIAVLKINVPTASQAQGGLPVIELGDSSRLALGQTVVAIGNALGIFQNTVSTGVVSGLSREIRAQNEINQEKTMLRGLIQTDAAINPGNSGGPLIDIEGKAVGINAAMVFGAENIGFALPVNSAKKDLKEVVQFGRLRQPFLGVRYILLNKNLQKKYNLPVDFGALVIAEPNINQVIREAVVQGGPAHKAGIREADIILEIEKEKVDEEHGLTELLQKFAVGQKISLKLLRGSKEKFIQTVLTERS